MSVDARKEDFEHIELFGKPALFTNSRIDRVTVPGNLYCYDLRGSDNDPGRPVTVEDRVGVNHAGTVLTTEPVTIPKEGYLRIRGKINFLGERLDLQTFCQEHGMEYLPDPRQFELRPASPDEAGLFYSQEVRDKSLATVGHLRFDHGRSGNEFWSTWWPHNDDTLNTPEFKAELDDFVNEMREYGPLRNGSAMFDYCYSNGEKLDTNGGFGFVAESEHYRYCLRCTPRTGDYSYIYIYDKRQQELNMKSKEEPIIGTVSFASGETLAYTDPNIFVQVIKEELPYKPTSSFAYKVLTDDPAVRKAVDDILFDMFGEENPHRACNYGLTEAGKAQLQAVADPSRPHTYDWFVITDINTDAEQMVSGLTLEEATDRYRQLDTGNKRIGVTKDGIATVDIVVMLWGDEQFLSDHERLASFKDDPQISQAVETLHKILEAQTPEQGMTLGGM